MSEKGLVFQREEKAYEGNGGVQSVRSVKRKKRCVNGKEVHVKGKKICVKE